jgi:predicted patatin/cPLA2 family phospholipase
MRLSGAANSSIITKEKEQKLFKCALVLEGGGMRGLYGAGVLDFFATKQLVFSDVIGVSMGACNGANYLSNQSERNYRIPSTFVGDPRYLSYRRWCAGGDLFDMRFIFEDIVRELDPYDYHAFTSQPSRLHIVTTECRSGESIYWSDAADESDFARLLMASSSLPFAAKVVKFGRHHLLDGGISDPIPLAYAKSLSDKVVLVLTQPRQYRKKPMRFSWLVKLLYPRYKGLLRALQTRHQKYNRTMDEIEKLEQKGKIFVLRPSRKLPAARVEKNQKKLKATLDIGYRDAEERFEELMRYLEG